MSSKLDCSNENRGEECGHFKILIPAGIVGAIIGPKGKTISRLQDKTQTKIEISRVHDYYPGTSERVCLISGGLEAILQVHKFIMETINEKPHGDLSPCTDFDNRILFDRKQQVKILIPNKIVSKIIGLGGSTIRDIQERSGAFVQVSQISPDLTLYERCVRVMGEIPNVHFACRLILQKVVGDEVMNKFLNVSYTNVMCVPNFNPPGPAVQFREVSRNARSNALEVVVPPGSSFPNVPYSSLPLNATPIYPIDVNQLIETLKCMIGNAVSDEGLNDIRKAMSTLANYGVLELCLRILMNERVTPSPVLNDLLMEKTSLNAGTNYFLPSRSLNNQAVYFHDSDADPMAPNFITISDQLQGRFGPIGHLKKCDQQTLSHPCNHIHQ